MYYQKDKVSDIISVLMVMKHEFGKKPYSDTSELRRDAVKEFAEREFRAGRYVSMNSAEKTVHDACARRLKPDVNGIKEFDEIADQWLHDESMRMAEILLNHSEDRSQLATVVVFFKRKNGMCSRGCP
ncbi:hypothetical protein SAMN02745216_00486 [Desulfatibacillum alkenivorans DSM 16219]|jgi:hypothetical protein|uniref:Uncharacterized protein n=1 Tax=Desulfatibacillum alkenivorans DSM 16219 TaxID=1121393 RepID=A0A1M6DX84_9BACT|nr:hypothetical protein [Desulfatibacillum alkenivorans]SHI77874.1 hypothetical protein SAMN02745216_00486 [Desulfatibacillum alkenivorans DSM 16219]